MKFSDIPKITQVNYVVDVPLDYVDKWIEGIGEDTAIDLEPDFQRAHVWTESQQVRYVEWLLRGGRSGRDILWNCPGRMKLVEPGRMQLVDGLQRLTAVRLFMSNDLEIFGTHRLSDFHGRFPAMRYTLKFYVNDLETRAQVLQWYLDINSGGTQHTEDELAMVRKLLEEIQA